MSVISYDTTSVSFEIGDADPEDGFRRYGHSKKMRPDLPQMILTLTINRDGLSVRHWVFPSNSVHVRTVERVTEGLRPRRYLFVGDRGMVNQENLDFPECRQRKYLLGEKLRCDRTIGGVLGAIGRHGLLSTNEDRTTVDHTFPILSAVLRGFFVFLTVISGMLVLLENPYSRRSPPASTVRFGVLLSLASFSVNYDPSLFGGLLDRVRERLVRENEEGDEEAAPDNG